MAEQNSILYKYHVILSHLSVEGHLGCFHYLAIMNSTAVNMGVQVPVLFSDRVSLLPGLVLVH
jgi:hypothetical protein